MMLLHRFFKSVLGFLILAYQFSPLRLFIDIFSSLFFQAWNYALINGYTNRNAHWKTNPNNTRRMVLKKWEIAHSHITPMATWMLWWMSFYTLSCLLFLALSLSCHPSAYKQTFGSVLLLRYVSWKPLEVLTSSSSSKPPLSFSQTMPWMSVPVV